MWRSINYGRFTCKSAPRPPTPNNRTLLRARLVSSSSGHIQPVTSHLPSNKTINQSINQSINSGSINQSALPICVCSPVHISADQHPFKPHRVHFKTNQANLVSEPFWSFLVQDKSTLTSAVQSVRLVLARFHLIFSHHCPHCAHCGPAQGQHSPPQKHNTIPVPHAHPPQGHPLGPLPTASAPRPHPISEFHSSWRVRLRIIAQGSSHDTLTAWCRAESLGERDRRGQREDSRQQRTT